MKIKPAPKGLKDIARKNGWEASDTAVRRRTGLNITAADREAAERLVSVAIKSGDDFNHGFRSHRELRQSLGYANPEKHRRGDVDGFWTSKNRFVTRAEAAQVGVAAGQLHNSWSRPGGRELLSSDVW